MTDGMGRGTGAGAAPGAVDSARGAADDGAGRRSRLVEAALACGVVLALCVVVLSDPTQPASPGAFLAVVGFGALAVLGGAIPRVALGLTILGIFAYYAAGFPPLGMVLPAVGALYLAAARARIVWAVGGAVILLAVATYFRLVDADPSALFTGYEYVTELALAAAAIAFGAAVRFARDARRQGERVAELVAAEQTHLAERRVQEERLRIARDLHDTVGHQLTVAALHASVAEEALGTDPVSGPALESARAALQRVRTANAEVLRELRGAVRLLRVDDRDPLGIASLARTAADAGLRVSLDEAGLRSLPALPAGVAETAGRILTEAVTNVLRHASATTLRIDARVGGQGVHAAAGRGDRRIPEPGGGATDPTAGDALLLMVSDDGVGSGPAALEAGHGIAGMRERAALVGGNLRIDTAPGGGCAVHAELPLNTVRGEGER